MIFRRMVVLNAIVLFVLTLFMVWLNVGITDEMVRNEIFSTFDRAMDDGLAEMELTFRQARDLALEISILPGIQKSLNEHFANRDIPSSYSLQKVCEGCSDILRLFPAGQANVLQIDPNGNLWDIVGPSGEVANMAEIAPHWHHSLLESKGGFIWDYHYNEYGSFIRVSRLIYSEQNWNNVVGAVSVRINSDYLRSRLSSIWLGQSGTAYLFDQENNLLFPYLGEREIPKQIFESKKPTYVKVSKDDLVFGRSLSTNGFRLVGLVSNIRAIERVDKNRSLIILVAVVLLVIAMAFTFGIAHRVSNPIIRLSETMKEVEEGNFDVAFKAPSGKGEIATLYRNFKSMLDMRKGLIEEIFGAKVREKEIELQWLQAQINPHFLYNTLDSIHWMAMKYGADDIEEAITDLSHMLRYSLNGGMNIIAVSEEIIQIKSYLKLQCMRFPDVFDVDYDLDPQAMDCLIIKLLLQPLVENAIIHGFNGISDRGKLTIKILKEEDVLFFQVSNNGNLIDLEKIQLSLLPPQDSRPRSYGLRNVNDRLRQYYGDQSQLQFRVEGDLSVVYFMIPLREKGPSDG